MTSNKKKAPVKRKEAAGKGRVPPEKDKCSGGPCACACNPIPLKTPADLLGAAETLYNDNVRGACDDKQTKCRAYVLQVAGALYRTCSIEDRLAEVERQLVELEQLKEQNKL